MRPPEFTGGNTPFARREFELAYASMRPPEFTGGNRLHIHETSRQSLPGASMRPPEFTGGNRNVPVEAARLRPSLQ